MKKLFTTIASALLLLSQGISAKFLPARRSSEQKKDGLLCLDIPQESPSKWRLMHGSHCSHASHASHFSMFVQTKTDSIQDVPKEYEDFIISKLSEQHACKPDSVIIKSLFLSKGADILHQHLHDIDEVLFSDSTEYYLYLNYIIVGVEKEKSSYRSIAHAGAPYDYELIVPFSRSKTKYFYIREPQTIFEERDFSSWMIDLIKKMEEK